MNQTDLNNSVGGYLDHLLETEKSFATRKTYLRGIRQFIAWMEDGAELTKETVIRYKDQLQSRYKPAAVNSKLASLNSLFAFLGHPELRVKLLRLQRQTYCAQEKELTEREYRRLVKAAKEQGNEKLALVLQTICATGIRVSELRFITVKAVEDGEAVIRLKGKTRTILLPKKLRRLLRYYIRQQGLAAGAVFVTRTGRPLDRSNIWRMMKALCQSAGVEPGKVFPHNLRHLFARRFYAIDHDIAKLADILGHSSINTTRIYIITTSREHLRCLERMDLVLG